ncbi:MULTISPECIES: hypothetical protein [Comamonas]|uniref:hypothetical protein n=1 Tax=Comamonas TaxID=283 RepID=UPI000ACD4703|nr:MULTISPECIES: hypothetical protein [Comamonas]MBD9531554.1 hypothetical protein [Comamonas sp. CMM01]BBL24748.1 hypothetical protein CT3_22030 [Comamonas terrigena NBRC 13299]
MATPNYGYEKRQRELAKKQKKEEKLREKAQRKQSDTDAPHAGDAPAPSGDGAGPTAN